MDTQFFTIKLSFTNCYLLKCNDGFLLIDTGYEKDYPLFLKKIKKLNIDIDCINYVFLTHHHDDHTGFLYLLRKDTDFKLICHATAVPLLKKGKNDMSQGGFINKQISVIMKLRSIFITKNPYCFHPININENDYLVENDNNELLSSLGINGRILYTPGHSIDSICILLDNDKLFSGDTAVRMFLYAGTKYCTILNADIERVYETWRIFFTYPIKTIYPGHGKPFTLKQLKENIDYHTNH